MRHHTDSFLDAATERVEVSPASEATVVKIGQVSAFNGSIYGPGAIFVQGTPTDRAAFLRHMAEQLTAAADALAAVEVAS